MRSMPQALLWETMSHGRWTLPGFFVLAMLLPLLIYGALSGMTIDPKAQEFVALQFGFVPIVIFQLAIGVAIAQGPHSRLYALPISSNSIVAWHLFSGAVILALETAAVAWVLNTLFHVDWPILGPALFATAAWSSLQVIMSVSSQQSLPAFCLAGTPAVLLCLWLQTRYGSWLSPPKHYWGELTPTEVATLFVAFGVCYAMTNYAVGIARCGERMPTLGIWNWLAKQWDKFTLSRSSMPRFRSAAEAQFWFEWKVKGIALPLMVMIVLLMAVPCGLWTWYMQISSLNSLYQVVLFLGFFVSFLAFATGIFSGLDVDTKPAGQRETQLGDTISGAQFESGMGSFLISRPFSNKEFATAILWSAARSSIIAWLMWVVVYAACVLAMWLTKQTPDSWMPREAGFLFLPLTLLGPWVAITNLGTIGLSGRGVKFLFGFVSAVVGYCVLMGIVGHFTSALAVLQLHKVVTTVVSVLLVVAAIWAYIEARRKGYISSKALFAGSLVGVVLGIGGILLRPADVHFIFFPLTIAFAALVVMPIALMPLAIAWHRHR